MAGTCRGTLGEVRDGLKTSGTDRGTIKEILDGLGDPRVGTGRV